MTILGTFRNAFLAANVILLSCRHDYVVSVATNPALKRWAKLFLPLRGAVAYAALKRRSSTVLRASEGLSAGLLRASDSLSAGFEVVCRFKTVNRRTWWQVG